jgi:adenylosuccinate lyase
VEFTIKKPEPLYPEKIMSHHNIYQEPLVSRYTSVEMQELFSERFKFTTWRRCWLALAEAQHELGLKLVTREMVDELRGHIDDIDFATAAQKEKEIRHDVMAHVYTYGLKCPKAEAIIHLGATSQFVVCNTDLIIQKKALKLIKKTLVNVIANLAAFCRKHSALATLGFTHYQPAQPTTVGKRNTLYIQDLLMDLDYIELLEKQLKARGAKGTVGTQATFLELFEGDHGKVRELDRLVSKKLGFDEVFAVTGQTYPRKLDMKTAETLSGIGASAHKFAVDMRSERMTGLARKLMGLPANFAATAANQWFERTLDDSAIRRMDMAQAFLLADAILKLYVNITSDMVVYPKQIEKHLKEELPFMATEKIMMACVERGKSRQEMHAVIRDHSVEAGLSVKQEGSGNDLIQRLANDDRVPFTGDELADIIENFNDFTGRAAEQTMEFLEEVAGPVLEKHRDKIGGIDSSLNV